jgi:hypothetical protein
VNSVTATVNGTSDQVTFTAIGASSVVSAAQSTVSSSPTSVVANGSTQATITVTLRDSNGNPVSNKAVTLSSSRGATDSISPASIQTNSSGQATFTATSLTAGAATLSATDTTDTVAVSPSTASVTFTVGAPTSIAVNSGNNQTGSVGAGLSQSFVAVVKDVNGNQVTGTQVDWAVTAGGGSLSSTSNNTVSGGLSSSTLTLGTVAETNTVTATIDGTSTSVSFTATATSGPVSASQSQITSSPTSLRKSCLRKNSDCFFKSRGHGLDFSGIRSVHRIGRRNVLSHFNDSRLFDLHRN